MQNTPSVSDKTFFRLVNDINLAFARLFNHQAAHIGLTSAHWRVIGGLYRHNGLTQTELANTLAMARSPLGKIVDKLEESGLVERRPDPDDRRVKRLHLTEKANVVMEPARTLTAKLEHNALQVLSDTDQQDLLRNLVGIRAALSAELAHEKDSGMLHHLEIN